ncbi:MAG TPA: M67 family metallopeptidase [Candidatus Macondimonas sp.]|nr:M67 family metallopeptidase [Candidatus Macondimonas sp.]
MKDPALALSRFGRTLDQALCAAAATQPEREICGLIGAATGRVPSIYPIPNRAADPRRRYSMDPTAQIAAFKTMRTRDETLAAIYHSHPHGTAVPSRRDCREWTYPEALCLIVGLGGGIPHLRAWRWSAVGFAPVCLQTERPDLLPKPLCQPRLSP